MNDFTQHFRMEAPDAIAYVREKLSYFEPDEPLRCEEIGDGNINYVFRVVSARDGRSLILKQADFKLRSTGRALDTDHNRIEAQVLALQGELAPGLVPRVYHYDPVMCCIAMEDLTGCENMRAALLARKTFPRFAEDITTFLTNTLLGTTGWVLAPQHKRELMAQFSNPDLCEISERLVYSDPYTNRSGKNTPFGPNESFLRQELYEDEALLFAVAQLKEAFLSKAQCLIHGDLHTGSIFVSADQTRVLDPEFAFFGPGGYDIGNVIAHLIFSWVNAYATEQDPAVKTTFLAWAEQTICQVVARFTVKGEQLLADRCDDPLAQAPGFTHALVADMLHDAAAVAGLELNRRVVGVAKVKDLTSIENEQQRLLAERICVRCAKKLILFHASAFLQGADYLAALHEAARQTTRELAAKEEGSDARLS